VFGFDLNTFFQQINAVLIVLAAKASFGRRQRTEKSGAMWVQWEFGQTEQFWNTEKPILFNILLCSCAALLFEWLSSSCCSSAPPGCWV